MLSAQSPWRFIVYSYIKNIEQFISYLFFREFFDSCLLRSVRREKNRLETSYLNVFDCYKTRVIMICSRSRDTCCSLATLATFCLYTTEYPSDFPLTTGTDPKTMTAVDSEFPPSGYYIFTTCMSLLSMHILIRTFIRMTDLRARDVRVRTLTRARRYESSQKRQNVRPSTPILSLRGGRVPKRL